VILLAGHDEPSLAAKKKRRKTSSKRAASTPKNRIWGFENTSPGRPVPDQQLSWETATGSVQYSYENASGRAYYYSRDHLDSVREVCNSSGTILTRYSYDPYGKTAVSHLSGSVDATFQYTGIYAHSTSGLQLAVFRAYDPNTGRWINRDPIQEAGGLNLYEYCSDDPVDQTDTIGLLDTGVNTAPPPPPPTTVPPPPKPIPRVIPRGPLPPGAMWARGGLWGIAAGLAIYDGYEGYQIYSMNQATALVKAHCDKVQECLDKVEREYYDHCSTYCSKLKDANQRRRCYEEAMETWNKAKDSCLGKPRR
jgi:RHS repeat-associated protein